MANLLGGVFAFFVFNACWTQLVGHPTFYCIAKWATLPLFAPWWNLTLPALTLAFLYVLFAGHGWRAAGTVFFLMLVVTAGPQWIEQIGTWGSRCG